ncbi:mucin-2 isoform X3 [Engraulis encrasicolus]|uniref:mucin-2 isoform X3 n=1 Tax=Engraulis encrasicolus TaxID=184585 RepID=UPI002FD6D6E5
MDNQLALCTCLLLIGVVVNIQCSDNSSAISTTQPTQQTPNNSTNNNVTITPDVDNSTSHFNTVTENSTMPMSPEVNTGHSDFSSISPRPTAASSSPDNTSPGEEHITTRGTPTSTVNTATSGQSLGPETTLTSTKVPPPQPQTTNKEMETFTAQDSSVQEATPQPASPVPDPVVESEPDREEPVSEGPKATELETSGSQEPLTPEKPEKMDLVDLNDGEPTASTKTSMESLEDQLNDNNSNNYHMRANGCVTIALDEEAVTAD